MTKDDLAKEIAKNTGIDKIEVMKTIEALMKTIKGSMVKGQNIYLRSFGTFVVKKRAKKTARNITKKTPMMIPEHFVPTFKPSREFLNLIKTKKI